MEDTTWDALERLKHLDQEARLSLVRGLFKKGEINANGFTLYQHHVVPAILGAQEALHPDAVSLHYAQIRAGLRWSYVDEEQSRFWERQTLSLLEGRVAPLCFETYSLYILSDYNSLVPEPQKPFPSETSSESDDVSLDDGAINTPDVTTSTRNTVSLGLHTEPTPPSPTPSLSVCDKTDSMSPVSEACTPIEDNRHIELASPSSPTPSLPVCDQTESVSPLSEGYASSKKDNSPDVPECPSEIQDVLDRLGKLSEDSSERHDCYEELSALLSCDGFTLFKHHGDALVRDGFPRPSLAVYSWSGVWTRFPDKEKKQWKKCTNALKKALQKSGEKQSKALYAFNTDQSHNKARRYRSLAHSSLMAFEDGQSLERNQSAAPMDPTSIIDVLAGRSTFDLHIEDVIAHVMRGIDSRRESDPGLELRFRWRGLRIDYRSTHTAFYSVRERLRACVQRGLSVEEVETACSDRQAALNDLMKPLVYHNRTSPAFSDMSQIVLTEGDMSTCHAGYDSSLKWVDYILHKTRPFDPKQKTSIVEALIKHLRWAVTKSVSPPVCSNREFGDRIRAYRLHAKLLRCFVREDLGELPPYHDLLEQTMHGFWVTEPEMADQVNQYGRNGKK